MDLHLESRRDVIIAAVLVIVCSGNSCTLKDTGRRGHATRWDSTGITIVESPPEGVGLSWRVADDPSLAIGEGDDPRALFVHVFQASRGVRVQILVVDGPGGRIAVFDSAGSYVRDLGRQGQGPGEYVTPFQLFADTATLYVHDLAGRIVAFSDDGEAVDTWSLPNEALASVSGAGLIRTEGFGVLGYLGGLRFLVKSGSFVPNVATGMVQERVHVSTWRASSDSVEELVWLVGDHRFVVERPSRVSARIPHLGGLTQIVVGNGRIYANDGTFFGVRTYDSSGQLVQISRADRGLVAVDGAIQQRWREYRSQTESAAPEGAQGRLRELFEETPFVDSLPPFQEVIVDQLGFLWALESPDRDWDEPAATYHIFDTDGVYLGSLRLPDAFRATYADEEVVIGVSQNGLGVHSVRVYQLDRGIS